MKNYSFFRIVGCAFLSIGLSTARVNAQNFLTFRAIYNFDIGDEWHFHRIEYGGSCTNPYLISDACINFQITGKHISPGNDTVFYERAYKYSAHAGSSQWDSTSVQTVYYTNLESTWRDYYSRYAFANDSSADYCNGRVFNVVSWPVGMDGMSSQKYVEGLGETDYYYYAIGQGQYSLIDNRLMFYKKGTEEWGSPHTVSVNMQPATNLTMIVTPNPASGKVKILIGNGIDSNLDIFSVQGQRVASFPAVRAGDFIDISHLRAGLYILEFTGKLKRLSSRLVVN